jgi:hypothetical protein
MTGLATQTPPVSVVIPTYNRAHLIARAVRSVLRAVAPGDEVIVVDDGSTDNTREVLGEFGDHVRLVAGPHRGCGAARNVGIAAARCPLIAFNDSDDEWDADKLVMQRALLRARPDLLFCFSDFGLRYPDGREAANGLFGWHRDMRSWTELLGPETAFSSLAPLPTGRADFGVHIGNLYRTMLRANYVAAQTTLIWRERAGDALHFAEDVKIHEDYACFARLAQRGPAAYMDCITFWQWGHDGPRVSAASELRWSSDRVRVLERIWGQDQDFLDQHGEQYRATLAAERVAHASALIRVGQTAQARAELRLAGGGPLKYRLAAALPGSVVRWGTALRHMLPVGLSVGLIHGDDLRESLSVLCA